MKRSIQKQRFLLIATLATPLFGYANLSSAADDASYHKHMAAKKTLYLANPYGFSAQQRQGPLQELVAMLQSRRAEVWEPFARSSQIDQTSPG